MQGVGDNSLRLRRLCGSECRLATSSALERGISGNVGNFFITGGVTRSLALLLPRNASECCSACASVAFIMESRSPADCRLKETLSSRHCGPSLPCFPSSASAPEERRPLRLDRNLLIDSLPSDILRFNVNRVSVSCTSSKVSNDNVLCTIPCPAFDVVWN